MLLRCILQDVLYLRFNSIVEHFRLCVPLTAFEFDECVQPVHQRLLRLFNGFRQPAAVELAINRDDQYGNHAHRQNHKKQTSDRPKYSAAGDPLLYERQSERQDHAALNRRNGRGHANNLLPLPGDGGSI